MNALAGLRGAAPLLMLSLALVAQAGASALRDGSHDFDFEIGRWKTHSSRLMHPLAHSTEWRDLDGITDVSKVWGGRANLVELKSDGPAGAVQLMALRLYNPESHQWSISFATPKGGVLGVPGVGEWRNGRVEFHDQEAFDGRQILVRFAVWSETPDLAHSEQAFSDDGGHTWEVNWKTDYTRIKP